MKPDERWPVPLSEVAAHGILDHRFQFLKRLGFGEDGMTEGSCLETALWGFLYEKDDLCGARLDLLRAVLNAETSHPCRPNFPNARCNSQTAVYNKI